MYNWHRFYPVNQFDDDVQANDEHAFRVVRLRQGDQLHEHVAANCKFHAFSDGALLTLLDELGVLGEQDVLNVVDERLDVDVDPEIHIVILRYLRIVKEFFKLPFELTPLKLDFIFINFNFLLFECFLW